MARDGRLVASRASDADDWEVGYALLSGTLLIASVVTTVVVVRRTATPGRTSLARMAAIILAIVATASTFVAWAFVVWAVLLAAGYAALALTSPVFRRALWLSGALLAGVAGAFVGVAAKLGSPGSSNDYSDAQDWGMTIACALTAAVLLVLATVRAESPA